MNKVEWIDNLRVFATLSVITLHVASQGAYNMQTIPFSDWCISAFFESLRFCVPGFVMITGTVLLHKDYEITTFFKKKLIKIVLPFLFFSIIYLFYTYNIIKLIKERNFNDFAKHFFLSLKNGSYYHLWYIYMLIGLYIMTPVVRMYIKNADKKNIRYFLALWLIYSLIKGYALNDYFPNLYFPVAIDYLGYFVLGYYLSKYPIENTKLGFIMFLGGTIATFLIIFYFAYTKNEFRDIYYGYNTLNVIVQSIGAYLLFYNSKINNTLIANVRNTLSKHSFNIYLIHALILSLLTTYGMTWDFINPTIGILTSTIVCLLLSLLTSVIIKSIPGLNKYL